MLSLSLSLALSLVATDIGLLARFSQLQYSKVQYSAVQCSTVQDSTVQWSNVGRCASPVVRLVLPAEPVLAEMSAAS